MSTDTAAEKLQFVMRQLMVATGRCLITTLELPRCNMKGQDAESLAGVLGQCPALVQISLFGNAFGAGGTVMLSEFLGQCTALVHLNLSGNEIGAAGAQSLAGVLAQCTALAHLNLSLNGIKDVGKGGFELCGVVKPLD
jgi:Ran GTPase-activating protein (RanGAP) involved in mRNA processing and transport